jgi:hypothetical protein
MRRGPSPVIGYLLLLLPRRSSAAEAVAASSSGCVDGGVLACRGSHWVVVPRGLHPLRPNRQHHMQAMPCRAVRRAHRPPSPKTNQAQINPQSGSFIFPGAQTATGMKYMKYRISQAKLQNTRHIAPIATSCGGSRPKSSPHGHGNWHRAHKHIGGITRKIPRARGGESHTQRACAVVRAQRVPAAWRQRPLRLLRPPPACHPC